MKLEGTEKRTDGEQGDGPTIDPRSTRVATVSWERRGKGWADDRLEGRWSCLESSTTRTATQGSLGLPNADRQPRFHRLIIRFSSTEVVLPPRCREKSDHCLLTCPRSPTVV